MRQHQREGGEAEPDHDRRQNERLWNGIGVRLDQGRCAIRNNGGPGTGEAARREDQQIRPVGEQAETDDELRSRRRSIR